MSLELLNCPFCGGAAVERGEFAGVQCSICLSMLVQYGLPITCSRTAEQWNRRVLPREWGELAAAMEELLGVDIGEYAWDEMTDEAQSKSIKARARARAALRGVRGEDA